MSYILVFVAMTVLDFIWAVYTKSVSDNKPLLASAFAVGIVVVGAFVTISYVANHWMLIPAGLGAFAGTWIAVQFSKIDFNILDKDFKL